VATNLRSVVLWRQSELPPYAEPSVGRLYVCSYRLVSYRRGIIAVLNDLHGSSLV
jgi:hypothetical protein